MQNVMPVLDKAKGPSSWTISTVAEMNQTSHSVATVDWGPTTVVTVKTLVLSVKVINTMNLWVPVATCCYSDILLLRH